MTVGRPVPMARAGMMSAAYGGRSAMKRRRQNVLLTLGAIVAVTGMIGFGMGYRTMMVACFVAIVLLCGYVYLLVQLRRVEDERAMRFAWSNAA